MKKELYTFLRRAEREDLDTILAWMEDPEFQYFLYGDEAQSQRQIREKIILMLGRTPANAPPSVLHLLMDSKEEGLLGMIGLQNISWKNRSCSLDIYVKPSHRGAGMLTAISVFRALEYVFDELNLHRVSALIYSFNKNSWRILERSGAQRELVLKDHVYRDNQLYDAYAYGLLRSEFYAMRDALGSKGDRFSLQSMIAALAEESGAEA
ncbi:MAG: GNAT family N-acetyltransferase [Candidatus Hydrogenedens sp.]|jgi:ribosomal-protein-alanine N-acetyltransferase|nr:GNAT family N-acetyltransferase [Candidatus Hydrogenedens sp.]